MSNQDTLSNTTSARERIEARVNPANTAALTIGARGAMQFSTMTDIMEFAKLMSISTVAVPKHLREQPGACLAVVIQASEWQMSPYAVANKSYSVNDRLGYEAQLVAAVILRRAPIKGRIKYDYAGEGEKRVCTVTVTTTDGETITHSSPMFGNITPKNSPLWKSDPDQQQGYHTVRAMCRRHFPDVLLGVYTMDELQDNPETVTQRTASGRVVNEEAPTISGYDELPPLDPVDGLEEPHESPVEVSEATERARLMEGIAETNSDCEITLATFGGKAKKAGFMEATETIRDVSIEKLRVIHENRLAIAQS